jgi:hypothetical protein
MAEITFGWQKDKFDQRDYLHKPMLVKLPASVDLSSLLPEVRDQGRVSSCTGFGIGANVGAVAKSIKVFTEWYSPTWIYNGARFIEGTLFVDAGAYPKDCLDWLVQMGCLLEHFWPYDPTKFDPAAPSTARQQQAIKYPNFAYYRCVDGVAGIMSALADAEASLLAGGPAWLVSIGAPWFSIWMNPGPSGILLPTSANNPIAGGHETCLTKDTKIALLDGRDRSIETLLAEYGPSGQFWVYSCDEKGNIRPGLAHSLRRTGINQSLLKINFDNGESIKCTLDEQFLLRDGSYRQADNLKPGDSLMPLYRKLSEDKNHLNGYEMLYNPATDDWQYTHRIVADKYPLGAGKFVRHHKNFNKLDNRPENFRWMAWLEHTILHREQARLLLNYAQSDEGRAKSRELMTALWSERHDEMYARIVANGFKYRAKASREGRLGFQTADKEVLRSQCRANSLLARGRHLSPDAGQRGGEAQRQTWENNYDRLIQSSMVNLALAWEKNKQGLTNAQSEARRANAIRLNERRWHPITPQVVNHKIESIEVIGCEDVYDFMVDEYHNFALASGVFVHNCIAGYDQAKGLFYGQNSWGAAWGASGRFYMPFQAIDVFKQMGGYDAHYLKFTPVAPPPPPPTPPTIMSVNPNYGYRMQVKTVVITGTNFKGAQLSVIFGSGNGVNVTGFTIDSPNQITANIAIANDATFGDNDVSVITDQGKAVLLAGFTVKPRCKILNI